MGERARVDVIDFGVAKFGFVNVPDRLYKRFTDARHADDLALRGRIRLGTLYEFRNTDGWDERRGDGREGVFEITFISKSNETIPLDTPIWSLKPVVGRLGTPILSHGGGLTVGVNYPDAFIYCTTSSAHSQDVVEYGEFCVEIEDVRGFFGAITRALASSSRILDHPHGFLAPCTYWNRELTIESALTQVNEPHVAFLKPENRASEREVRAIWSPRVHPAVPVFLECPELIPLCKRQP